MIYFLKHIDIEGAGTLGSFLAEKGFTSRTIELYHGDPLPASFDNMDAVVILGGPMNVYEEEKYPFIRIETEFIRELIKRDIPTVGLCLGAQLIAKASGARVYQSPIKEIGIRSLKVTEKGGDDPVLRGLPEKCRFFQWHEDTFDLPAGADLLIEGSDCRNQAFRIGKHVYGFQCHMEVMKQEALCWLREYVSSDLEKFYEMEKEFYRQFDLYEQELDQAAQKIYNNLFHLIKSRSVSLNSALCL